MLEKSPWIIDNNVMILVGGYCEHLSFVIGVRNGRGMGIVGGVPTVGGYGGYKQIYLTIT